MVWIIQNIQDLIEIFTTVALSNPISFLLMLIGGLVLFFSITLFGILSMGGIIDFIIPDSISQSSRPDVE